MKYLPLDLCQALKEQGFPQDEYPQYVWHHEVVGPWRLAWGREPSIFSPGAVACPDILTALEWLEREKGWRWRRDAAGWWAILDAYGVTHRLRSADNPIDLIRQVLAHLQAVQPQEAQP